MTRWELGEDLADDLDDATDRALDAMLAATETPAETARLTGKPVPEFRLLGVERQTWEDYCAEPAINWSTLSAMRKSPLHYQHALKHTRKETHPMARGRAVHCAVFEPDEFPLRFPVWDRHRRGNEWKDFKTLHAGKTILTVNKYRETIALRDAVRRHPLVAPYLREGLPEATVTWKHEATGLRCKGRMDWIGSAILDLKTTTKSIEGRGFGGTAATFGYHCQLAFYSDGVWAAARKRLPAVLVAVEAEAPYDVAVYQVDEDALFAGAEEYQELLGRVAECQRTGKWPGRYEAEQALTLPAWAFPDENEVADGIVFPGDEEKSA